VSDQLRLDFPEQPFRMVFYDTATGEPYFAVEVLGGAGARWEAAAKWGSVAWSEHERTGGWAEETARALALFNALCPAGPGDCQPIRPAEE
jgi:hypothetical protein